MESGINPVVAGGRVAGWVSGDPAGLAASATLQVSFDLGPEWDQYVLCALNVFVQGPSSGLAGILLRPSDSLVAVIARASRDAFSTNASPLAAALSAASAVAEYGLRPKGRYVLLSMTNADAVNACGATSKVTLTAYPN